MIRSHTETLIRWKDQNSGKPLLLLGARQVGKSHSMRAFGSDHFERTHLFDFELNPELHEIFERNLEPERIIQQLSLHQQSRNEAPIEEGDLILFDEIQECEKALASLRYFYEKKSPHFVLAAGSLLGVKLTGSFPVGRVQELNIFPMTFSEFVGASKNSFAIDCLSSKELSRPAFDALWELFLDYLFVGGMPEAVGAWFQEGTPEIRAHSVKTAQSVILSGYTKDFVKHAGKINANHIFRVFSDVPRQLAHTQDASTKRFTFKGILPGQSRYSQLAGPIEWLKLAGLVHSVGLVDGRCELPFEAFAKQNLFKLFLFDVGLLGNMLGLDFVSQRSQNYGLTKGYVAEAFVASELVAAGHRLFSWQHERSEIEFLLNRENTIIPLEVKSGKRTRAKSLEVFRKRFHTQRTVKLVGVQGLEKTNSRDLVLPVYFAGLINEIL